MVVVTVSIQGSVGCTRRERVNRKFFSRNIRAAAAAAAAAADDDDVREGNVFQLSPQFLDGWLLEELYYAVPIAT
jgi:hypothetical protein